MTIGFDISLLMYAGSGVATYMQNLVQTLIETHPKHSYKLFYSSLRKPPAYFDFVKSIGNKAQIYTYHIPPRFFNYMWNTYHVGSIEKFIGQVDVFHSSDYLRPPMSSSTRSVTTIHDLTWKKFPQFHTQAIIDLHTKKLEKTIQYNDTIIVDSENTKKDLLHYFPSCKKDNVHTLHLGIDKRFGKLSTSNKTKAVLKKYGVQTSSDFLLYVGAIEPRKNLDRAIHIFANLIKEKEYRDYRFLLVGRAGWKNEHIFKLISDLGLEEKIQFVGYVTDEDLPHFYNAAKANIYLSLYEGFGLPPLEAARCGTPTLMYRNSSLTETFPSNYLFAQDGEELSTLKMILEKAPSLSFSEKFTWEKYAKKYLEIVM